MKLKLFKKDMLPACSYCVHSKSLHDTVLCKRHGIVSANHHCRKFRYDPIKRIPEKKQPVPTFKPEDFSLDC